MSETENDPQLMRDAITDACDELASALQRFTAAYGTASHDEALWGVAMACAFATGRLGLWHDRS